MIDRTHSKLSVARQCKLLAISRSGLYYQPRPESDENLALMRAIDHRYLETPFYGSRQMRNHPRRQDHKINRKRVRRLHPAPRAQCLSVPAAVIRIFPNDGSALRLIGALLVEQNEVWQERQYPNMDEFAEWAAAADDNVIHLDS